MAKTPNEAREYQRGYTRSSRNHRDRVERALRIARGYRDRLAAPSETRSCETCDRWTRGCDSCVWGYCRADFEWGVEPRMWAEQFVGKEAPKIVTQPDFCCTSWIAKQA